MSAVLDRFLRYVRYDTQSDETSQTFPSTDKQLVLLRALADELRSLGLSDAAIDSHGYVTATVPATTSSTAVPAIGFISHVDTSPEVSGANVRPIVHRRYDGRDLALPDDPSAILRLSECAPLADRIGDDIVTASGTTLLGADNKAGVAEIVTAAEYLLAHPEIAHGPIKVAFTPDEEIGRGTKFFDVAAFGATYAYTMDGSTRGDLEFESFSADAITLTFVGFNTHPGYAKDRLVNAVKVAAAFICRLPRDMAPETTDGYEGFVHPYVLQGGGETTSVRLIIRDFKTAALKEKALMLERLAHETAAEYGARVEIAIEEQYRNMREVLDKHPQVVDYAREAIRRAGMTVREGPIRGGTDGSKLSFMGLPTPNIFAGEHNFHSRLEWVSVQDMEKAVEVIVHLCRVWEEMADNQAR
jgi:tripeptide aminopeptidase